MRVRVGTPDHHAGMAVLFLALAGQLLWFGTCGGWKEVVDYQCPTEEVLRE